MRNIRFDPLFDRLSTTHGGHTRRIKQKWFIDHSFQHITPAYPIQRVVLPCIVETASPSPAALDLPRTGCQRVEEVTDLAECRQLRAVNSAVACASFQTAEGRCIKSRRCWREIKSTSGSCWLGLSGDVCYVIGASRSEKLQESAFFAGATGARRPAPKTNVQLLSEQRPLLEQMAGSTWSAVVRPPTASTTPTTVTAMQ